MAKAIEDILRSLKCVEDSLSKNLDYDFASRNVYDLPKIFLLRAIESMNKQEGDDSLKYLNCYLDVVNAFENGLKISDPSSKRNYDSLKNVFRTLKKRGYFDKNEVLKRPYENLGQ